MIVGGPRALVVALSVVVLWACQPDEPRRRGADAPVEARDTDREAPAETDFEPAPYRVFNEVPEDEPPPRATLHLLVDSRASRGQLRATFRDALERYAEEHPDVVAVRGVGYLGTPRGPAGGREVDLTPVAWAEWLPPDGWHDATPESRNAFHRLYFYQGTPPPWQR